MLVRESKIKKVVWGMDLGLVGLCVKHMFLNKLIIFGN